MSTGGTGKKGFWELGPPWIVAIGTLIAAIAAAGAGGFFAGKSADGPQATTTVTVTPSDASSPSLPHNPATSTPTDTTNQPSGYVDKQLGVPQPDNYVEIDFDKPVVSTSSLVTGTDLEYNAFDGFRPANEAQVGTGPTERPSDSSACVDSVETRPIKDPTEAETIDVGSAFCVITDEGNIVWFTVTERSRDPYSPGFTFRATMLPR